MYLRVLEFLVSAGIIWALITQIIIPGFKGTQSFPIFKKEEKLKEKLEEIKQKVEEKKLEKKIKTIKQKEGV
jgi:hypothetical protein